jgi:hypothetical protein
LDRDGLFSHSLLVFALFHCGSAANLVLHMAMGRLLPPGEYGVFAALLGVFLMLFVPLFFAVQNSLAHFSRRLVLEGRTADIRRLVRRWNLHGLLLGLVPLAAALAWARPLADLFHLSGARPVILTAFTVYAASIMPVFGGAFLGLQRFVIMAAAAHGWTVLRLALAVPLVAVVSATADAALAAQLASILATAGMGWALRRRVLPEEPPSGFPLDRANRYFFGSLTAILFYSMLMNADIVLVKIFFPEDEFYAPYARASVIGRLIVFLSQPLAGALFPKVVARKGMTPESLGLLLRATVLAAVLIGAVTGFFLLFPRLPLLLLFDDFAAPPNTVFLVRAVCAGMAPLGLVFLIMNFELAQNRFGLIVPLGLSAAVYVIGFSLHHPSPVWAAVWLWIAAPAAALSLIGLVAWQKKRVCHREG